jgi:hypothetical protein
VIGGSRPGLFLNTFRQSPNVRSMKIKRGLKEINGG